MPNNGTGTIMARRRERKAQCQLREKLITDGQSILELMIEHVKEKLEIGDRDGAFAAMCQVAPYLHPKLAATEVKMESEVRQTVVNGEPLSIEEFDQKYGVQRPN